jgi:uncharacterized membrane protein
MGTPDGREREPEPGPEPGDWARFTSRVRLQAFSDGVMAIAITLSVLSIEVPTGVSSAGVGHAIAGLIPDVLTYLLSFAVVGLFWLGHHAIIDRVARVDRALLTLNLCFLAAISLVPVVTELMNRDAVSGLTVVSYATVMALAAASELAMWVHADRAGLVDEAVTREERSYRLYRLVTVVAVFALSIPIAFASPTWAELFWIVIPLRPLFLRIRHRRRTRAPS